MHPLGQFGIADSPLGLQQGKDSAVYCVKFGHGRKFFHDGRDFQRILR